MAARTLPLLFRRPGASWLQDFSARRSDAVCRLFRGPALAEYLDAVLQVPLAPRSPVVLTKVETKLPGRLRVC